MPGKIKETKISGFQFGKIRICLTYITEKELPFGRYRITKNRKHLITTWNDKEAVSIYWRAINEVLNQTTLNI